jgi:hypothetical protein
MPYLGQTSIGLTKQVDCPTLGGAGNQPLSISSLAFKFIDFVSNQN